MRIKKTLIHFDQVFLLINSILFAFGVSEEFLLPLLITNVVVSLIYLIVKIVNGEKLLLPKNFSIYLFFLLVAIVHTVIFTGKLTFLLLMVSGGLFLVTGRNLKHYISNQLPNFILIIGFLMLLSYIALNALGLHSFGLNNLFLPLAEGTLHNHMGDLWAISLIILIHRAITKFNKFQIPLILIGLVVVAMAFSRSAVLSLVAGTVYIFTSIKNSVLPKRLIPVFILIAIGLFVFLSGPKTTILSRPYVYEGISSIIKSPLGIGLGNFYKVSVESPLAHNLILEVVTGLGVFSLVFLYWLILISKNIIKNRDNTLFTAIFIGLSVNFLFDTTYTIPVMIWIWFLSLSQIESNENA